MALRHVTVQNRSFNVDGAHFPVWWDRVIEGSWEPATLKVFEKYSEPGNIVVDIGAWVGGTVLYAAAGGADVITFEPDPVAFPILQKNVDTNPDLAKQINITNAAIGIENGQVELFNNAPGNSGSSLSNFFGYTNEGTQAPCATVEMLDGRAVLESLEMDRVSLVKIDIEGAEYDLIPRIAPVLERYRPALHLSLHPLNIAGESQEARDANKREKSLAVAKALDFYKYARCESGDLKDIVDPVVPFKEQAEGERPPTSAWLFSDQ